MSYIKVEYYQSSENNQTEKEAGCSNFLLVLWIVDEESEEKHSQAFTGLDHDLKKVIHFLNALEGCVDTAERENASKTTKKSVEDSKS